MHTPILHLSGPDGSGKSTLARMLVEYLAGMQVKHIRFNVHRGVTPPPLRLVASGDGAIRYLHCYVNPETVFETFSDVVATLPPDDDVSVIVAETDAHPCFRHAYPYDVKVFILTVPARLQDIFRSPQETADAIERAMHDTAEFAAEMFGLEPASGHDSAFLPPIDPRGSHATGTLQSVDDFLHSSVGAEITARLKLRPAYQGIVDSDVVVLNTGMGTNGTSLSPCVGRIQALLEPLRDRRQTLLAPCDPIDRRDEQTDRTLRRIAELVAASHAA